MKCVVPVHGHVAAVSRPVWGAWIEICLLFAGYPLHAGRAPYGARGLKFKAIESQKHSAQVAPRMGRVD